LNFAEPCLKKKFDSDILKFENCVNYMQKYNLHQYFCFNSFMCRVSVEVKKGSSLGYTVSHEKFLYYLKISALHYSLKNFISFNAIYKSRLIVEIFNRQRWDEVIKLGMIVSKYLR
jgi:hypothetical protein